MKLLEVFFLGNKLADMSEVVPMFIKELVGRFTDTSKDVLVAVRDATAALLSSQPSLDAFLPHLDFTRNMITSLASDARHRKGAVLEVGGFIRFLFFFRKRFFRCSLRPFILACIDTASPAVNGLCLLGLPYVACTYPHGFRP